MDESNLWIYGRKARKHCKHRVFCFPYAGAGASIYRKWNQYFDETVEICPIQLPGRENRLQDAMYDDIIFLARAIGENLRPFMDKPFTFFGHSMGGILAYEVSCYLMRNYNMKPVHLFMSASALEREGPLRVSKLDDDMLENHLFGLGNIEKTWIRSETFKKRYFPVIRNDYAMVEKYHPSVKKINCPITAFASLADQEVTIDDVLKLATVTKEFELQILHGNHLFVDEKGPAICKALNEKIGG